jgi:GntR family transcriptional regulator
MSQPSPPRYQRIADDVRLRVRTGALRVGDALPSELTLARQFGVQRNTVRQALAILRDEGLIATGARSRRMTFRPDGKPAELTFIYRAQVV